jgi:hypothetical protein
MSEAKFNPHTESGLPCGGSDAIQGKKRVGVVELSQATVHVRMGTK